MCEVLLTFPSFSGDMTCILSWEPPHHCQSVNVGSWLPISQWLRQRVDAVIGELCPISCPGDVSGRAGCGSTGQNKCWVVHWCQYKVDGDNLWWCLKDSWKRLIIAVKLNKNFKVKPQLVSQARLSRGSVAHETIGYLSHSLKCLPWIRTTRINDGHASYVLAPQCTMCVYMQDKNELLRSTYTWNICSIHNPIISNI